MNYLVSHIANIIQAEASIKADENIDHLILDSRKIPLTGHSLFFAIVGPRRNGHQFITDLYKKGVRSFVVSEKIQAENYPEANFLIVDDTLYALQLLTAWHRKQFSFPVIGISGSNGKTIVKEWLYQLLNKEYSIVRSPKSYNSQIGVPLSVWQINEEHTLGIFEAGISEQGEMIRLEKIIQPTIGVLTNIGEAHSDGFNDDAHKFREKMVLFRNCDAVIVRQKDYENGKEALDMFPESLQILTWGNDTNNTFVVDEILKEHSNTNFTIRSNYGDVNISIPFTDDAAVENAITCGCVLFYLGVDLKTIENRMMNLHPVNMRLELVKGINNCSIINDSYSADLNSLQIALNFLDQQSAGVKKTIILSDFLHSAFSEEELYAEIFNSIVSHQVTRVIGIGEKLAIHLAKQATSAGKEINIELFSSTEEFLLQLKTSSFKDEIILVKGARVFAFEKIVQLLEQKVHQTVLEINLNSIVHNLKQYQKLLQPSTKIMAMVKAFAYGSGGAEIAGILQYHRVDYLGVAYADEGVELRKTSISLPIMVMNPEQSSFHAIIEYQLQPVIYSFGLLETFTSFLRNEGLENYPVHIEIETGMNRLGFDTAALDKLTASINAENLIRVETVFSHLAASEEAAQDEFTKVQFEKFEGAVNELRQQIGYDFIKHIGNSAAIIRHPHLQMDMVRLGIGLYGVDSAATGKLDLQPVATLKSTVAQIKHLKTGESVSYNRKSVVSRDSIIATVRIGYADGYSRRLGNGIGKMIIGGQVVSVIGTVCMDMTMVDVTEVPGVKEGDEVIVIGKDISVQQLAEWTGTIPYEIMTGISQRVKRIYYEE